MNNFHTITPYVPSNIIYPRPRAFCILIPKCAAFTTYLALLHYIRDSILSKAMGTHFTMESHKSYKEMVKILKHVPQRVYAIVRNPYDRAFSYALFLTKRIQKDISDEELIASAKENFESFFNDEVDDDNKGMKTILKRPMHEMLEGIPKERRFLFQFENINLENSVRDFYTNFLKENGAETDSLQIGHLNKTLGEESYIHYFTPAMIQIVNSIYRKDFEEFGYEMLSVVSV